ncbi:SHOCT domain-containing protein [Streptomyces boninensis]|uniref:SHOCT domain-containing protein n=1 Tax=Streptomyces boninensis TaxID=2039455 RepID=UPI003B21AB7E
MIRRRVGRPGLLGAMARTAVITGTASAVSGRMRRGAEQREADQYAAAQAQQQALADQAAAQVAAQQAQQAAQAAQAAPAAAPAANDRMAKLRELGELRASGVLTEEEFAAEKARILAS